MASSEIRSEPIPMPVATVPPLPLTAYKVLSFDVYGTLIEYKSHILASFMPLLKRLPTKSVYRDATPLSPDIAGCATRGNIEFLKLFQRLEDAIKLEKPVRRFDQILTEIWRRAAQALEVSTTEGEALAFGSVENIASWPPFEGTVEALQSLSRRYRLVALSNIDRFAWEVTTSATVEGRGSLGEIPWWKVLTAEDFGEDDLYRADDVKLEKMLASCYANDRNEIDNVSQHQILHVAQSLGHDHAPAKRLKLASVFLIGDGRRWGKDQESQTAVERELVGYAWRCRDLSEFASLVERAFQSDDSST